MDDCKQEVQDFVKQDTCVSLFICLFYVNDSMKRFVKYTATTLYLNGLTAGTAALWQGWCTSGLTIHYVIG